MTQKNHILSFLIAAGIGLSGWMALPQTAEAGSRDRDHVHTYHQRHAPICRPFTRVSFQYGRFRESYGTACLRRDGNWYVASEDGWPGAQYQRIIFADGRDRHNWNDRRDRYYEGRRDRHDHHHHRYDHRDGPDRHR